jgi:hypothetical protein
MAHEGTTSAARGRIIKKGSGSPASPVTSRWELRRSRRVKDRRLVSPKLSPRTRELVKTFILIPAIFAASAAFMWTRPVGRVDVAEESSARGLDERFHSIGNELADRFSTQPTGVVISPPKKEPVREARPTKADTVRPVSVVVPDKAPRHHEIEALEKQVHRILKRHGKPTQNGKELASAIVKEALLQDYDPVFVAAVIKSESAFNALAKSHKGAQGLMQIMPKTGAWLADQAAIPRGKLTDPGHNLKLGISYLKQLEAEYKGNRMLTLVAYNWGPGHVESASAGSRRVPGEVMQYAIKILNDYRRWSSELRSAVG